MKSKINLKSEPFVSVVTPVYNGEAYLSECIESVLNQTFDNYEYIIVNNCSKDRTLEIAQRFAKKDSRIKVYNNKTFLGIIENHNMAFSLISAESKYCKVVSADDYIFPECVAKMVEVAELNPSVGIVGSYQIRGTKILWQGLKYPTMVFNGKEVCRSSLLGGPHIFGNPTSVLYRSDLIKGKESFFPNSSPHADTSAFYEYLQNTDFGFVYQVLSNARVHNQTMSSLSQRLNMVRPARINDLLTYGKFYLNKEEIGKCFRKGMDQYYRYLAGKVFDFEDKKFWDFHKDQLKNLGYPFKKSMIIYSLIQEFIKLLFNFQEGCSKMLRHLKYNFIQRYEEKKG